MCKYTIGFKLQETLLSGRLVEQTRAILRTRARWPKHDKDLRRKMWGHDT